MAKDTISYLTLGDGDFSYSLDLIRYLSSSDSVVTATPPPRHLKITATGIDSLEELQEKYRDADFILRGIRSAASVGDDAKNPKRLKTIDGAGTPPTFPCDTTVSVSIRHGINAILPSPSTRSPLDPHKHVIFNHPHLGTEDAKLHSRFLSHLFHSSHHHWLARPGGILHLTLASEQCERWKCEEVARAHGFVLLRRSPFVPPPPREGDAPAFSSRRHQSGKSFRGRVSGGSETLAFGRIGEEKQYGARDLPWQRAGSVEPDDRPFKCTVCPKSFGEERSLRNHVRSVHSSEGDVKDSLLCEYCAKGPEARRFSNVKALRDHERAKHLGRHTDIKPDWFKETKIEDAGETSTDDILSPGSCHICGLEYETKEGAASHLTDFIPDLRQIAVVKGCDGGHRCVKCFKLFREKRAQLQHENTCSVLKKLEAMGSHVDSREVTSKFQAENDISED